MTKQKYPLTVTVKNDSETPAAIEVIAQSVIDVSEAMKKIRSGKLTDRALILLIQDTCGVNQSDIKRVLDACEVLGHRYTKAAKN